MEAIVKIIAKLAFGDAAIWHSVMFNNASAILALANGMLPLRKARRIRDLKVLSVRKAAAGDVQ